MTYDPQSKLPLPVEVTGFVFLTSPAAPAHTVLEFQNSSKSRPSFSNETPTRKVGSRGENCGNEN